jgi:hypothetical protein
LTFVVRQDEVERDWVGFPQPRRETFVRSAWVRHEERVLIFCQLALVEKDEKVAVYLTDVMKKACPSETRERGFVTAISLRELN